MFLVQWENDESLDVLFNGEVVASVNHDLHGHAGMEAVVDVVYEIAKQLGVDYKESGL